MSDLNNVFKETFPQLAEQLKEYGVKSTAQLKQRFESNDKYLIELLDYDLKDNEKIRSMAESSELNPYIEGDGVKWWVWVVVPMFFLGMFFLLRWIVS
jgi:hypothetical protein